jgi:hypothetical protein
METRRERETIKEEEAITSEDFDSLMNLCVLLLFLREVIQEMQEADEV